MIKKKILIVEDDAVIALNIKSILEEKGYEICAIATSADEAIDAAVQQIPDLILIDILLRGGKDGIDAAEEIKGKIDSPVIYVTAFSDEKTLDRLKKTGPYGYITKPISSTELLFMVSIALYRHESEKKISSVEKRHKDLFASMHNGYANCKMIYDTDGAPVDWIFLEVNRAFEDITGLKRENVIDKRATEAIPGIERDAPELFEIYGRMAITGEENNFVIYLDAFNKWLSINAYSPEKGYFIIVFQDITEKKRAKDELVLTNRILDAFITLPDDKVYEELLKITLKAMESEYGIIGYFTHEGSYVVPALSRTIFWEKCMVADKEFVFDHDNFMGIWSRVIDERKTIIINSGPFDLPEGHVALDNTIITPLIHKGKIISTIHLANKKTGYHERDRQLLEMIAKNIAPVLGARLERDRKEEKLIREDELLRASLREKEILLTEIHHRVKNNLQIISSLIQLQAGKLKDETSRESFKICENRVRSMAMIHERIYRSKDFSSINFGEYLRELAGEIYESNGVSQKEILCSIEAGDVSMNVHKAIPCGLLVTELLTNSLKHGFPGNTKGEINIALGKDSAGNYSLTVRDNGISIPEKLDLKQTGTLGLLLVEALVKQLNGSIRVTADRGTKSEITFPE